jgi:hypothetical protein
MANETYVVPRINTLVNTTLATGQAAAATFVETILKDTTYVKGSLVLHPVTEYNAGSTVTWMWNITYSVLIEIA